MPRVVCGVIETVAALVASTSAGPLMHGGHTMGEVLLFDGEDAAEGSGRAGDGASLAARLAALGGGGHGGMEGGELVHHALVLLLLVGVDGLGMLAEIVETRELLAAVASERSLSGVFPVYIVV